MRCRAVGCSFEVGHEGPHGKPAAGPARVESEGIFPKLSVPIAPNPRGLARYALALRASDLIESAADEAARAWFLAASFPSVPAGVILDASKKKTADEAFEVFRAAGFEPEPPPKPRTSDEERVGWRKPHLDGVCGAGCPYCDEDGLPRGTVLRGRPFGQVIGSPTGFHFEGEAIHVWRDNEEPPFRLDAFDGKSGYRAILAEGGKPARFAGREAAIEGAEAVSDEGYTGKPPGHIFDAQCPECEGTGSIEGPVSCNVRVDLCCGGCFAAIPCPVCHKPEDCPACAAEEAEANRSNEDPTVNEDGSDADWDWEDNNH